MALDPVPALLRASRHLSHDRAVIAGRYLALGLACLALAAGLTWRDDRIMRLRMWIICMVFLGSILASYIVWPNA